MRGVRSPVHRLLIIGPVVLLFGLASLAEAQRAEPIPRVRTGVVRVGPRYGRAIVQRVVRRNIRRIRLCYERELRRDPRREGRVVVRWTIDAEGNVASAEVIETTLNAPSVEQCIVGVIRRLRFPEPPGGGVIHVTYPFILRNEDGQHRRGQAVE